jgi:hypothetical protein
MHEPDPRDPIVDRVREIRMRLSEQFGHDPVELGKHLRELQASYTGPLISIDE